MAALGGPHKILRTVYSSVPVPVPVPFPFPFLFLFMFVLLLLFLFVLVPVLFVVLVCLRATLSFKSFSLASAPFKGSELRHGGPAAELSHFSKCLYNQ